MKLRGRGIGCNLYGVGYGFNRPDHSAALVEVTDDGSVLIMSGACDMGQGSDTALCQIAAEELGVPYDHVRIISGDSDSTPDALASTASRQTFVSGKAVQLASRDAKNHLLRFCGELNNIDEGEQLIVKDNKVFVEVLVSRYSFPELAKAAHEWGSVSLDLPGTTTPQPTLIKRRIKVTLTHVIYMQPRSLMLKLIRKLEK